MANIYRRYAGGPSMASGWLEYMQKRLFDSSSIVAHCAVNSSSVGGFSCLCVRSRARRRFSIVFFISHILNDRRGKFVKLGNHCRVAGAAVINIGQHVKTLQDFMRAGLFALVANNAQVIGYF